MMQCKRSNIKNGNRGGWNIKKNDNQVIQDYKVIKFASIKTKTK